MQPPAAAGGIGPARVLLIDDHEISRAAVSALLRTEGLDVTDVRATDTAIVVAATFRPSVAVVDVTPGNTVGFRIADRLQALPDAPDVLLTSSTGRYEFGSQLDGYRFIPKADLRALTIAASS